jgi:hypothetical protein
VISSLKNEEFGDDAPKPDDPDVPGPKVKLEEESLEADRLAININEWLEQSLPRYGFVTIRIPEYNDFGDVVANGLSVFQILDVPRAIVTIRTTSVKPLRAPRM